MKSKELKELKEQVIKACSKLWYSQESTSMETFPLVTFTKSKRVLGQADIRNNKLVFNENLLENDVTILLNDTIPHEIAHFAAYYYDRKKHGHDRVWKNFAILYGATPRATANIDANLLRSKDDIEVLFKVFCNCSEHLVSKKLYNKIKQSHTYFYKCKDCGSRIVVK